MGSKARPWYFIWKYDEITKEKLIVEVASTDRKKCYELTPFGREVLELEYNRLQRSVRNGNSILGE